MFTGLVEDLGTVVAVDTTQDGARLTLDTRLAATSPRATRSPSTALPDGRGHATAASAPT